VNRQGVWARERRAGARAGSGISHLLVTGWVALGLSLGGIGRKNGTIMRSHRWDVLTEDTHQGQGTVRFLRQRTLYRKRRANTGRGEQGLSRCHADLDLNILSLRDTVTLRSWRGLLRILYDDLHPTVLLAPGRGVVAGNGTLQPHTRYRHALGGDTALRQVMPDRLGAPLRQPLVVPGASVTPPNPGATPVPALLSQ
jgi:hypothetical protein